MSSSSGNDHQKAFTQNGASSESNDVSSTKKKPNTNIFASRKYLLPFHLQPEATRFEKTWKVSKFVNGKSYLEVEVPAEWQTKGCLLQFWCGLYKRNISIETNQRAELITENVSERFLLVGGDGRMDEFLVNGRGLIVQHHGDGASSGAGAGIGGNGATLQFTMLQNLMQQQQLMMSQLQSISSQLNSLEQRFEESEVRRDRKMDLVTHQVETHVEQALCRMNLNMQNIMTVSADGIKSRVHSQNGSPRSTTTTTTGLSSSPTGSGSLLPAKLHPSDDLTGADHLEEWMHVTPPPPTVERLSEMRPLLESHASSTSKTEIRIIESEFDRMQRFNHPLLMDCFDNLLRDEYINGSSSANSLLQYLLKNQQLIIESGDEDDSSSTHDPNDLSSTQPAKREFKTQNPAPNPPPQVRLRILTSSKQPVESRDGFVHLQPRGKYRLQVENGLSQSIYYSLLYWDHKHVIHPVGSRISELKANKLKKFNLNVFQSGIAERYKLLFSIDKPPCDSEKWFSETLSIWVEPERG